MGHARFTLVGCLVAWLATGCTDIAGLDDLRFAAGGGGGAEGGAGAGGEGGAVVGIPAPDWTASFGAVYLFEPEPLPIGFESSGNGPELGSVMGPKRTEDAKMQGASALAADGAAYLASASADFDPSPMQPLTIGGWFRVEASLESAVFLSKGDGTPEGYLLERTQDGAFACAGGGQRSEAGDGTWPERTWRHAVCVYDPVSGDMFGFLDGAETIVNTDNLAWQLIGDPLGVGGPSDPYAGQVDEVFFVGSVLDPDSIRRIYACGLDGKRCSCDEDDPTAYASCGLQADSACLGLPDCNQTVP